MRWHGLTDARVLVAEVLAGLSAKESGQVRAAAAGTVVPHRAEGVTPAVLARQ